MKKILGITAVALIVGAPALAQNASTMTYKLQLGGEPSPTPADRYNITNAIETGVYNMASGVDVLNWSARVIVDGTIDGVTPGGAANIVFDLALKKDNALVGGGLTGDTDGGFGIGVENGEAGFFSKIMNNPAGGAFAQQPAAFPYVYDTFYDPEGIDATDDLIGAPYARLIDPVVVPDGPDADTYPDPANGVNMAQFTYPSTFKYYRPAGAAAANTTTVTAASGMLMGMGAGYTDFNFTPDAPERGGIGLQSDGNSGQQCYGCTGNDFWCMDVQGRPLVEGQINMKGMAAGTYTLELIAGTGNNVLLPTVACSPYGAGASGAFAAAAGTVTGSTMTFVYNPIPPVDTTPVVDGGAVSRQYHGATLGYLDMPLFAGGIPATGNVAVEPRRSTSAPNPWTITVLFNKNLGPAPTVVATGTNGNPTLGTPTVAGNALSIPITAYADRNCISLSITNVTSALGSAPNASPYVIKVVALQGDVNLNRLVNVNDVNLEASKSGASMADPLNWRYDINCNGVINVNDVNLLSTKSVAGTIGCAYP